MSYKVNHTRMKVYAKPLALSEKEKAEVKAYLDLGYTISEPKEKKEANEDNKFSAAAIQKYLEEKGTKEQQKKYWELYNAPAIDKKTGLPKTYKNDTATHKAGDVRERGHIATLRWFKKTFPNYK